ncbi:MAG: hypothetical protein Q4A21_02635 [bacterium]|nr:hypothetical protein [bacterium]
MRNFLKKVATFAKSHPVMLSTLAVATVGLIAAQAWGPDRKLFTMESPAPYITFNSISNNPVIGGSETDFVGIREKGSNAAWTNQMKVQPGKEYQVRMYVHNDASENLNLVAENVTAKFNLPTTTGRNIQVLGAVSASNANPGQVHDGANFVADQDFNLAYVAGSAIYENNVFKNGTKLPDSIMTSTGAKLGYDKMDGRIPGCMKYSGVVVITVKPQFAEVSKISLSKTVRKIGGEKKWSEIVDAKSGDTVEFQIDAKNEGTSTIKNLVIRDTLPNGLEYIKGSAKLYNANNGFKGASIDDTVVLGDHGANMGAYTAGSNAIVRLRAKVVENAKLPVCGTNTLTNLAQASDQKVVQNDTASVRVNKTCEQLKVPVYQCTALTVKPISAISGSNPTYNNGRPYGSVTYEATTSYKVEHTQITGVRYIVKTSNGTVIANKTIAANEKFQFTVDKYKNEKYTVTSTIITANGENTNANCSYTFEVKYEEPKTPIVKCENLVISKISRTKFEVSVNITKINVVNNVTVKYEIKNSNGQIVKTFENNGSKTNIEINTVGKYTIKATVISNGAQSSTCEKQIIVEELPKVNTPSISIEKTVNGVKNLITPENRDFNYEITVSNTGNVDLKNVKVTDKTPENIKFISSDKGEIKDDVLTYVIPTLKVGEKQTITIKAQALKVGKMKNIACVDTPTIPGDNDGCDSANVEVPPKETPTPPAPQTPSVPAELPRTGADLQAILAIFSLTTAFGYYFVSLKK